MWLQNCRKRVLVSCWTNSYLCNTTGVRYPMWHHISTGNQDRHVFGSSWEVFAASSLFSESSRSGVSTGTNSEKNWRKVVDCISACHGRFHLATYFMLKWVLSSFCSARNDTSVPEKTARAPWSQKYCRKGSRVIGNLTMSHRDWTTLGCGCQWLAFSSREGSGLHKVGSCQSSSSLLSSPEMSMQQSCQWQRAVNMPRKQSTYAMATWIVWEQVCGMANINLHNKDVWLPHHAKHSGCFQHRQCVSREVCTEQGVQSKGTAHAGCWH